MAFGGLCSVLCMSGQQVSRSFSALQSCFPPCQPWCVLVPGVFPLRLWDFTSPVVWWCEILVGTISSACWGPSLYTFPLSLEYIQKNMWMTYHQSLEPLNVLPYFVAYQWPHVVSDRNVDYLQVYGYRKVILQSPRSSLLVTAGNEQTKISLPCPSVQQSKVGNLSQWDSYHLRKVFERGC